MPFLGRQCVKRQNDGLISGVYTLKPATSGPAVCCPVRLYANSFEIFHDVALITFSPLIPLVPGNGVTIETGECLAVFGKGWRKTCGFQHAAV